MTAALLLMMAPAFAQVPVLVSRFEDECSVEVEQALRAALEAHEVYHAVTAADVAFIEGQTGEVYIDACEPDGLVGCTFQLAELAEARLALVGRVEGHSSTGLVRVEISILDVEELQEGMELVLPYDPGSPQGFTDEVLSALADVLAGRSREELDIRVQAMEEAQEPPEPYDPEKDPEVLDRALYGMEDERSTPDAGPEWEERPRYGLDQLMEEMGEEAPWDLEGLSPRRYLAWWNSGWDMDTWASLARGRKGQILLRACAGAGFGPVSGLYHGRYALEEGTNRLLEVYAMQQVEGGLGSSLGLSAGVGLASRLEIELGLSREGGRYRVEILKEVGEADPEAHIDSTSANGNLRLHGGVRIAPMPVSRLGPLVGIGVAYQRGSDVTAHGSLPMDDFEVFQAPSVVGVYLAPGAELRLQDHIDLFIQAPLTLMVKGGDGEVMDQGGAYLEDKLKAADSPSFGAALQAGVQLRAGK